MTIKRQSFTSKFKAKVALAALSQLKTISEIATEHQVSPTQIISWKKQLQGECDHLFTDRRKKKDESQERLIDELYKQVGQQKVELDWLKKKVGLLC
jgi:transposase-like protein